MEVIGSLIDEIGIQDCLRLLIEWEYSDFAAIVAQTLLKQGRLIVRLTDPIEVEYESIMDENDEAIKEIEF